jgi:hypothetical protein
MRAAMGAGRLIAGRYRLQDPIGRGAMGVVWRGRDELLHRDVAVKEMMVTTEQAPGDSRRTIGTASYQRTLREARAAARLSHPGVVTIFDILDEAGRPWIVMELICGRSLDQVIAEDGPLPPPHAAQVGASLLSALAAAHAAGVLHRDVKPANVLVAADGRVVLTDFGIAKVGADPGLTQLGMVVGTPGFTAPERIRGEPATPASDLWSLGATLYAAVEGRGPFERPGGVAAICAGITREEPPRAPSAGALAPAIDALLRRDPAARPDAAATAALLARATADPTLAGTIPLPAAPPAAPGFLDPPPFDRLAMPGPPPPPGSQPVLPDFLDPAAGRNAAAPPPGPRPRYGARPGAPPRRSSWRLVATGASIAAIVIAALVGLKLYDRTLTAVPDGAAGTAARAGASGAPSTAAGTTTPATLGPAAQDAAYGPPPPGFAWHTFAAARLGTTAGFAIAVPAQWQAHLRGPAVYLAPAGNDGEGIEVSLAPFTAATPATEAREEQAAAIAAGEYPGYRRTAIEPTRFRGQPAAAWRFTWRSGTLARTTVLSVLVTLPTSAGAQPYALSLAAPSLHFPVARKVFDTALTTFRPLAG